MKTEYIYKNETDTIRIRIMKRIDDGDWNREGTGRLMGWDFDLFQKDVEDVYTFSSDCGDYFNKKSDCKGYLVERFGKLISINPKETVTEGWEG